MVRKRNRPGIKPATLDIARQTDTTQTFAPAEPQPNTGDFQDGIVTIQAPDIYDDPDVFERFYGRIIIYQD